MGEQTTPTEGSQGSEQTPEQGEATTSSWTEGFSDEQKAFVETKGFDSASKVVEAYTNLEKFVGVPKDQLLKVPEASDEAGREAFQIKLGRPEKKEGYEADFHEEASDGYKEALLESFFKNGVSKEAGKEIVKSLNEHFATIKETQDHEVEAKYDEQEEALKKEWGHKYAKNVGLAKKSASVMGVKDDDFASLEKVWGVDKTMKMFQMLGERMTESKFSEGGKSDTALQAQVAIDEMKGDSSFVDKLLAGDMASKKRWNDAHRIATLAT